MFACQLFPVFLSRLAFERLVSACLSMMIRLLCRIGCLEDLVFLDPSGMLGSVLMLTQWLLMEVKVTKEVPVVILWRNLKLLMEIRVVTCSHCVFHTNKAHSIKLEHKIPYPLKYFLNFTRVWCKYFFLNQCWVFSVCIAAKFKTHFLFFASL